MAGMERLTVRDSRQHAWYNNDGVLIRGANGTFHQKKDMTAHYIHDRFVALDKVIDHLASYEDIGMEPEEVVALRASFETLRDETVPLLQAKVEDRLVELPYRLGQNVYYCNFAFSREICPAIIISMELNKHTPQCPLWIRIEYVSELIGKHEYFSRSDIAIGKTIFSTRSEAETAVAKWKEQWE